MAKRDEVREVWRGVGKGGGGDEGRGSLCTKQERAARVGGKCKQKAKVALAWGEWEWCERERKRGREERKEKRVRIRDINL